MKKLILTGMVCLGIGFAAGKSNDVWRKTTSSQPREEECAYFSLGQSWYRGDGHTHSYEPASAAHVPLNIPADDAERLIEQLGAWDKRLEDYGRDTTVNVQPPGYVSNATIQTPDFSLTVHDCLKR